MIDFSHLANALAQWRAANGHTSVPMGTVPAAPVTPPAAVAKSDSGRSAAPPRRPAPPSQPPPPPVQTLSVNDEVDLDEEEAPDYQMSFQSADAPGEADFANDDATVVGGGR